MADGQQVFREREKVVAAEDLPGVPAGTPGVVLQVTGLSWIRYRVHFENGREINLLDAKQLARPTNSKSETAPGGR